MYGHWVRHCRYGRHRRTATKFGRDGRRVRLSTETERNRTLPHPTGRLNLKKYHPGNLPHRTKCRQPPGSGARGTKVMKLFVARKMTRSVKVLAALTSAEADRYGWDRWLTLNNRRQSIGPKPDSRSRLEGARYKYLTSCLRLLSPSSPFSHAHMHSHISSTRLLPFWVSTMGLSQKASAHIGWTPA